jgi:hypothetical protein
MNYKTHKDNLPFLGGCLQGQIETDYKKLVKLFGIPERGDGYKTDAEWVILFGDGSHCYIYNYKNGRNYLGKTAPPKTLIKCWNIGGINKDSFSHLEKLLNIKIK